MNKIAVIAIGGNSLIKDKAKIDLDSQLKCVKETCKYIAGMVDKGWNVVITHGNGPQVGFLLRRAEISADELPLIPLEIIGADTQGAIGYMIQQSLYNEFKKRKINCKAVTLVTQVKVSKDDSAFQNPTKPIGGFMSKKEAKKHACEDGWNVVEDAGRGWRRVVPSPIPQEIIEKDAINNLVNDGFVVICVGGGGIPVIEEGGSLKGVAAVIDKDYASSLLASNIGADLLLISTAVEKVSLNFGTKNQVDLNKMTLMEAKKYLKEGHFSPGSMGPKITAIINFLERGGQEALITCSEKIREALNGKTGTKIVNK